MTDPRRDRLLGLALLLVALVVVVDQAGLILENVYPFRLDAPQWRFTSVGNISLRYTPLVFADALLIVSAGFLAIRWWARLLGVVNLGFALVFLATTVFFALDAIQMRRLVRLELVQGLTVGAGRVLVMTAILSLATFWLSLRLFRMFGRPEKETKRGSARPLVVGAQTGPGHGDTG